jgi:hypothetical protein
MMKHVELVYSNEIKGFINQKWVWINPHVGLFKSTSEWLAYFERTNKALVIFTAQAWRWQLTAVAREKIPPQPTGISGNVAENDLGISKTQATSSDSAIPAAIFSHVATNSLKLIGDKVMPSTAAKARGQTSASSLPDG